MFKHLLVPLDGSPMSETAVVVAAEIALQCGAEVMLLHVLEESVQPTVHGQTHLTHYEQAEQYLQTIAKEKFSDPVKVTHHVHRHPVKNVAADVARHAGIIRPDLIVLCTHGGARLRDRLLGNIAQQIVGAEEIPVLMLQSGTTPTAILFKKILVLLDGNPEHESSLVPAASLAKACRAELVLMHVITSDDTLHPEESLSTGMLPNAAMELNTIKKQSAVTYLETIIQKLRQDGLSASGCVDEGSEVERIVDYIRQRNVDMVVLGTHGKAGTQAFWAGTLPPKLMRQLGTTSFLLVPSLVAK